MPLTACPLCNKRYPTTFIAAHAASCDPSKKRPRLKSSIRTKLYRTSRAKSSLPSETGAPGFHLFPTVFSDIEADLLNRIKAAPPRWTDYRFRKVKNYGPPYNLKERRFLFGQSAPPQIPIPPFVNDLILPRLRRLPILSQFEPNQLSVAEYSVPGGHILPHNDCENGKIRTAVVGVCLAARCTMTLILRARYNGLGKDVKTDVTLPAGGVYVMSGDALRVWEHAIFPKNIDATRYSLTFRDVSPAVRVSGDLDVSCVVQNTGVGELPKPRIRAREPGEHPASVKAVDKTTAKARVKRRRLIQQRLG